MKPFYTDAEFPVGTQLLLSDGRRFAIPDTPNRLSRTAWLYRVTPRDAPGTLYQLRVRRFEGLQPLQEALPPGLDWESVTVTGVVLQNTEYRLPLGFGFWLAYDIDANEPEEPDWDDSEVWEPADEEEEDELTAEQLLEEMLTDLALCITLLNLELKWMRSDKTVEVAKLAEATEQLERTTRMKAQYEAELARLRAAAAPQPTPKPSDNLIRFPGTTP